MLKLISFILLFSQIILSQSITVNRKHYFDNLGGAPPVADTGFYKFDAEDGVANLTINGTVTASTDQVYAGTYSYKITGVGGTTRCYAEITSFPTGYETVTTIWTTFRIYIPAATAVADGGWDYTILLHGSGDYISDNGEFALADNGTAIYAWQKPFGTEVSTNFSIGAWHKVEIKYVQGTGANAQDSCWIDETAIYGTTTGAGTVAVDGLMFGAFNWTMETTEAIYIDDLIVSETRLPLD